MIVANVPTPVARDIVCVLTRWSCKGDSVHLPFREHHIVVTCRKCLVIIVHGGVEVESAFRLVMARVRRHR